MAYAARLGLKQMGRAIPMLVVRVAGALLDRLGLQRSYRRRVST